MSDPGLALLQSRLGRPGCIDDRPIDRASIIFLPKSGNLLRCPAGDRYGFDLAARSVTRKRPINPILSSGREQRTSCLSMLVGAAVIAVFAVSEAVLIWADLQTRSRRRVVAQPQRRQSL